ncbi:MAG: 30S ribosomal protein S13 [Nanoarchaeota archaeon]
MEQRQQGQQRGQQKEQKYEEKLVRIHSEDIEGGMKVYAGLTKIKGVSWAIANAACKTLKIDKNRKIGSLIAEEIKKISDFLKNPQIPSYLLNRRKDFETGEDRHLSGSGLDLQREFDIKRLKKIKSYRGIRHASGQPVRGQRTRSHFRKNRPKGAGIRSKEKRPGKEQRSIK